MLTRHVYVSALADNLTDIDVQVILGASQIKNRRLDLTGLLVQGGRHFAQVLEGRSEAVAALVLRMRRDPRHHDVRTLLEEPIQTRQCARWAMGMRRRDDLAGLLAQVHRDGCAAVAEVHALLGLLLETPP